jgi:hypothetical protein
MLSEGAGHDGDGFGSNKSNVTYIDTREPAILRGLETAKRQLEDYRSYLEQESLKNFGKFSNCQDELNQLRQAHEGALSDMLTERERAAQERREFESRVLAERQDFEDRAAEKRKELEAQIEQLKSKVISEELRAQARAASVSRFIVRVRQRAVIATQRGDRARTIIIALLAVEALTLGAALFLTFRMFGLIVHM